jgi:hypothetical protein
MPRSSQTVMVEQSDVMVAQSEMMRAQSDVILAQSGVMQGESEIEVSRIIGRVGSIRAAKVSSWMGCWQRQQAEISPSSGSPSDYYIHI